jgi:hypothetical protein
MNHVIAKLALNTCFAKTLFTLFSIYVATSGTQLALLQMLRKVLLYVL